MTEPKKDTKTVTIDKSTGARIVEALGLHDVTKLAIVFDWNEKPHPRATATAEFLVKDEQGRYVADEVKLGEQPVPVPVGTAFEQFLGKNDLCESERRLAYIEGASYDVMLKIFKAGWDARKQVELREAYEGQESQ